MTVLLNHIRHANARFSPAMIDEKHPDVAPWLAGFIAALMLHRYTTRPSVISNDPHFMMFTNRGVARRLRAMVKKTMRYAYKNDVVCYDTAILERLTRAVVLNRHWQ